MSATLQGQIPAAINEMSRGLGTRLGLSARIALLVILGVSDSPASDLPEYIAAIDEKARQIDRLQTNEVKKSLLTGTDGGGAMSAFWYEGQVRRLKITIGMSNLLDCLWCVAALPANR